MTHAHGAHSNLRFTRSIAERIPTDRYYSHNVAGLRLLRPGTQVIGKKNLRKVRPSFCYQQAIGIAKGPSGEYEVDTLVLSDDRYPYYDTIVGTGSPPARIENYAAEGGMNSGSTELVRDQNPDTPRNKALRRFSLSQTEMATVWVGKKWLRTGRKKYTLLGLYTGDGMWQENRCNRTSFKYWTIGLRRAPDQFPRRIHTIEFGDA
jgi:hypothetical protein